MKPHFLLLGLIAFLFISCNSLYYTSIDVLRPAQVTFYPTNNDLLLVNNAAIQSSTYGHETNLLDKKINIDVSTDSLSIYCLDALKEEFDSRQFFSSVQLDSDMINANGNFRNRTRIPKKTINGLCNQFGSNVVLSLDKIIAKDVLNEYFIEDNNSYADELEATFLTEWSVYYPDSDKSSTVQFKDTMFWSSDESADRWDALSRLPKRSDALVDGALYVGRKCISRFLPFWDKEDRFIFSSNNKLMKQAMDSVVYRKWNAAIVKWKKLYDTTKNNQLKAKLANNIAIANEIGGNMDEALKYCNISLQIIENESYNKTYFLINDYYTLLNKRDKEIKLLKQQLGE